MTARIVSPEVMAALERAREDDSYACPCCGVSTGGGYCAACHAAECGERDHDDPSIGTCLATEAAR